MRRLLQEQLPALTPSVRSLTLPEIPVGGTALKAVEDQIDSVLCAYIGAYWWYWGAEQNVVLGNERDGYIVVPARRVGSVHAPRSCSSRCRRQVVTVSSERSRRSSAE